MMVVALGSFVLHVACVVFLLVRFELLLPLLNSLLSFWRRKRGWSSKDAVMELGPRIALNMEFVIQEKLLQKVRCCVSLFLALAAWLCQRFLPQLPMLCLMACIWDTAMVLQSPRQPESKLSWKDDRKTLYNLLAHFSASSLVVAKNIGLVFKARHGIPYGLQEGIYSKHMVFTGGVSLACYVLGVVHFIFLRFGAENFQDCDFAGASSGGWAALGALLAAHPGAPSVEATFRSGILSAVSLVYLFPFPFSLLLPGCQAVESFVTSIVWQAKMKTPGAYSAITSKGKLLIWFFACSLRRESGSRCYRFALRSGPDFESPHRLGAMIAATSVFPFFTSPRLCSTLQCLPAVMDGYFPGKGVSFLPVPDMIAPCVGNTLLFDISGVPRELYAGDKRVQVLNMKSWEDFSVWDLTACSPHACEDLFVRGVRGAAKHVVEIDAAVKQVFGLDPPEFYVAGG